MELAWVCTMRFVCVITSDVSILMLRRPARVHAWIGHMSHHAWLTVLVRHCGILPCVKHFSSTLSTRQLFCLRPSLRGRVGIC